MDYNNLSKTISHALRHEPWLYELELDPEGWVKIDQLLEALQNNQTSWSELNADNLSKMIALSEKKRHEIKEDRIRAIYGHSIPEKVVHQQSVPPSILYHGTSHAAIEQIMKHGLIPMKRQYVHMSAFREDAEMVGKRKANSPVILEILADRANETGVKFYKGNERVWLADGIPAEFILPDKGRL